jgi:hypothetical protein
MVQEFWEKLPTVKIVEGDDEIAPKEITMPRWAPWRGIDIDLDD